jgi:hypothetical protein
MAGCAERSEDREVSCAMTQRNEGREGMAEVS